MIKLKNITKSYTTGYTSLQVLKGIDLDIDEGEFVSIMGSSGSGKSTLLNILGILDEYDGGEYTLDGTLMRNLSQKQAAIYRNQFLGFVFQSFNLLNFKTAAENVALPLYYQKVPRKERKAIAIDYLDRVARALISKPKVILADEPTGALDSVTSHEVMNIFKEVNGQGITVILVTHEHDIALMSKRIIHLKDGLIEKNELVT